MESILLKRDALLKVKVPFLNTMRLLSDVLVGTALNVFCYKEAQVNFIFCDKNHNLCKL